MAVLRFTSGFKHRLLSLRRSLVNIRRKTTGDDDGLAGPVGAPTRGDQTTVNILNRDKEILMIDAFSQIGFRLNNGISVIGPMAIFSKSVLSWNIKGLHEIHQDSLSLFLHLEPKLDLLILGIGDEGNRLPPMIISYILSKKINVEILSTMHACSTFNFLNAEKRYVAAALIPPTKIKIIDDDVAATKRKYKRLFETEDETDLI